MARRDPCAMNATVVSTLWSANVRAGRPHEHEARFRSGQSERFTAGISSARFPLREDDGTIRRWYGTATDIDDRKRAEDALRESEAAAEAPRRTARASRRRPHERAVVRQRDAAQARSTVRVRIEKALRSSEERLLQGVSGEPRRDRHCTVTDGLILEVNERWEEMFGYSRAEAVGTDRGRARDRDE